jgi:hypothetical protein
VKAELPERLRSGSGKVRQFGAQEAIRDAADQAILQPLVGIRLALTVQHQDIVERLAVTRGMDTCVDDVGADSRKRRADSVEQALAVAREEADPGRAGARILSQTTLGVSPTSPALSAPTT